jgi:FkbM family methyltransferase
MKSQCVERDRKSIDHSRRSVTSKEVDRSEALALGKPSQRSSGQITTTGPMLTKPYHAHVQLYGQDAEARLLSDLLRDLPCRRVIDVGAERGDLAHELLQAGADELHAFEPHPKNIETLHTRFDDDSRVTIHESAVSDHDGYDQLHVSATPLGERLPFGHTLLERTDTDEITWDKTITVPLRSLGSLIDASELPKRVGILKIDTEATIWPWYRAWVPSKQTW